MGTVAGVRRPTQVAQELRRQATPAERRLWAEIGASKLGWKFSRQMPVGPYICDFMCRSARLVVELDGYSHDLTVDQDRVRMTFIRSRGFIILRFANEDVLNNSEGVVACINEALATMPTPQPPPASGRGSR